MDFLKDMKAKLEQLEKEAQMAMEHHQQQTQKALFQPKSQGQPQQQKQKRQKQTQKDHYPRGGGRQQPGTSRVRRPVDPGECQQINPSDEPVQRRRIAGSQIRPT